MKIQRPDVYSPLLVLLCSLLTSNNPSSLALALTPSCPISKVIPFHHPYQQLSAVLQSNLLDNSTAPSTLYIRPKGSWLDRIQTMATALTQHISLNTTNNNNPPTHNLIFVWPTHGDSQVNASWTDLFSPTPSPFPANLLLQDSFPKGCTVRTIVTYTQYASVLNHYTWEQLSSSGHKSASVLCLDILNPSAMYPAKHHIRYAVDSSDGTEYYSLPEFKHTAWFYQNLVPSSKYAVVFSFAIHSVCI